MYAKKDPVSTQASGNNSVNHLDIKYTSGYNLELDISCLNLAEIDPAKWTMISTAGPNANTQNGNPSNKRMLFPAENFKQTKKRKSLNGQVDEKALSTLPNSGTSAAKLKDKVRIRRPPNAFIVFANEWRKNIAAQNPQEKNKQISTRLGAMWKLMSKEQKEHYKNMARKLDAEHKEKYPDYVYCPKEARLKKALRAEARDLKGTNMKTSKTSTASNGTRSRHKASKEQHVDVKMFYESFYPEVVGREACSRPKSVPSRMLPGQEKGLQETTKGLRGQVGQNMFQGHTDKFLNVGITPYQQLASRLKAPRNGECVVIREADGQRWLPYLQKPQSRAIYIRIPNNSIKIQEGNLLAQRVTEVKQQVPSYPVKNEGLIRSCGSCKQIRPTAVTLGNSGPTSAGQIITHSDKGVGSSGDNVASNVQQQLRLHKHLAPSQNVITTKEGTRQIQEVTPMSLENSENPLPLRLLEDYADFIDKFLLQTDFNKEILAFRAVLELEKL